MNGRTMPRKLVISPLANAWHVELLANKTREDVTCASGRFAVSIVLARMNLYVGNEIPARMSLPAVVLRTKRNV